MSRNNDRSTEKVCGNQMAFKNGSPLRERVNVSRKDNNIRNFTDILNDTSIESKLFQNNYSVINKATLGNSDQYLMAHNKDGIMVYVLLDQNGILLERPNDVSYKNANPFLPNSIKNGIMNGVQNMAAGAALVCDNGICTLLYDEESNVSEKNFGDISEEDQYPSAYPIIRLSEIVNDPVGTNFGIAMTNKNLVNNSFSILNAELEELYSEVKELSNCVNQVRKTIFNKSLDLEKSINKISVANNYLIRNPPEHDDEREYAEKLSEMSKIRHDQIQTLLAIMQKVASEKRNIKAITEKIHQFENLCNQKIN